MKSIRKRWLIIGKYNIGEVWWVHFPFNDMDYDKHRPAIVIDDDTIAILALYVTSQNKDNPYSIEITDWRMAGLKVPSWARIDRIVSIDEWRMSSKIGALSHRDLLKILQLVQEINTNTYHDFSLVAIRRGDGKFLLRYDAVWECWLFPYFRTSDNNKANIDQQISENLCLDINTDYVTVGEHCKYSVKDEVYKRYKHKLYKVQLTNVPNRMNAGLFEMAEIRYRWMSIDEMEGDSEIMSKNGEVVAFVKKYLCDIISANG